MTATKAPKDTMNEHAHQKALFAWAELAKAQRPSLAGMYAIPNAAKRSPRLAAYMKAEGLRSGVPDICVPTRRHPYGALYIELKSATGRASAEQLVWIERLTNMGNKAVVCKGWLQAKRVIEDYLDGVIDG